MFYVDYSVLSPKSYIKVTKAIFCIYDIIFHRDIRVEVCFPGKITVYSIDDMLKQDVVSDLEWNCAFVSSVIRSFHPYSDVGIVIYPALKAKELYDAFLNAAIMVIKKGNMIYYLDFHLSTVQDVLETSPNDLAGEIINYFIRNYLYEEFNRFIKNCNIANELSYQ